MHRSNNWTDDAYLLPALPCLACAYCTGRVADGDDELNTINEVRAGGSMGGAQHVQVRDERGAGPARLRRAAGAPPPPPLQPALDHRVPPPDGPEQAPDRRQEPRLRPGRQGEELVRCVLGLLDWMHVCLSVCLPACVHAFMTTTKKSNRNPIRPALIFLIAAPMMHACPTTIFFF